MIVDTVALEKVLNVAFRKAQDELNKSGYRQGLRALVMEVKSTGSSEKYGWFGDVPDVKEWIGDKTAGEISDYELEIQNKDFYTEIAIDRNELEDDRSGIIKPRIESMVQAVGDHKLDLVATLIANGTTGLAYDGNAFFANRTTNDNLLAGTGITVAQLQTDIREARTAMMKFQSDTGWIMGLEMDTILCPPDLEGLILEACNSAPGAQTYNPLSKWIKAIIALPSLTDTNDWYGFCTTRAVAPFVYQSRKDPTPVLDSTQVARNRKLMYSVELRGNAGYGLYQLAVKTVNE